MTQSVLWILTVLNIIARAESAVSLSVYGYTDSSGNYQCNTSAILTCEITGYHVSMTWTIDEEIKSNCIFETCSSYPPFSGYYYFSSDTDNGIFNITINPLTLTDRGKQFSCSDGLLNDEVSLNITAESDDFKVTYTDNLLESTVDATTGCFSQNTNVEFIWRKIKVNATNSSTIYKREEGLVVPCVSKCLESGRIQRRSSLNISGDTNGDLVMFQVEIIYQHDPQNNAVYNFSQIFKIKEDHPDESNGNETPVAVIAGVTVTVGTCITVGLTILVLRKVVKPKPVEAFNEEGVTSSSITVTWESGSGRCIQPNYILRCLGNGRVCSSITVTDNITVHTFENLSAGTWYEFEIFAKILISTSSRQPTLLIVRTRGKPDKPTNFEVASNGVTESSIEVTWKPGHDGGSRQTFFLEYLDNEQNKEVVPILHSGGDELKHHTFPNLSERTSYVFTIYARNESGSSEIVGPLHIRTHGKPDKPINFKVTGVTESSITVQWGPGDDGGHQQTFILMYSKDEFKVPDQKGKKYLHYTFTDLIPATYYKFTIHARNEKGNSDKVELIPLRTNGKPDPPTQLALVRNGVKKKSITVEWERGLDGGFPQTFIITIYPNETESEHRVHDDKNASLLRHTLPKLKQATKYKLQIHAENEKGSSQPSRQLFVRTKGEPDPPTDFGVVDNGVTETSIRVRWKPGANGGFKQKFTLNVTGTKIQQEIEDNRKDDMQYELTHLAGGTWYEITIVARNKEGPSLIPKPLHVRTLGKPDPPTQLTLVSNSVKTKSITVEWERGFDGGFPQTFIITISPNETESEHRVLDDKNASLLRHTLPELKQSTEYKLQIHAENEKGSSQPSRQLFVRTKGEPDPPTDFSVVDNGVTETSIRVRWKPGANGGFKQKFTLNVTGTKIQKDIEDNRKDDMQYELTHLAGGTWYEITIIATNKEGSSLIPQPLHVRTLGRPDPPTDFCANSVRKSSIDVTWESGFDGGFPQTFVLECFKNDTDLQKTEKIHNTKEQHFEHTINGLSACTAYKLRIISENDKGISEPPLYVLAKTRGFPHEN